MELAVGHQRVLKVFKGDKCVSLDPINNNQVLNLDAIGKTNRASRKNIWEDISGNKNDMRLENFEYTNSGSGWRNNCLFIRNGSYGIKEYETEQTEQFTFNTTIKIEYGGSLYMEVPGISSISIINESITIRVNGSVLKRSNCIKYNKVYNITITYSYGELILYINGEKVSTKVNVYLANNKDLVLGNRNSNGYDFYVFSVLSYNTKMNEKDISKLSKMQLSRFISYIMDSCVLDVRGYNNLIRYGGQPYIFDNSVYRNHLKANNFIVHIPGKKAYNMVGINSFKLDGRYVLNSSFTIEFCFSKIVCAFSEETPLINNYVYNDNGFEILINTFQLIIRMHNKDNIQEFKIDLDYTDRKNCISITYDKPQKELLVYFDGAIAKKFNNVEYTIDMNNKVINICTDESKLLKFTGFINYIRFYERVLNQKEIYSNRELDIDIYERRKQ